MGEIRERRPRCRVGIRELRRRLYGADADRWRDLYAVRSHEEVFAKMTCSGREGWPLASTYRKSGLRKLERPLRPSGIDRHLTSPLLVNLTAFPTRFIRIWRSLVTPP